MKTEIEVDNIKCNGCASSIKSGLKSFPGVTEVSVDIDTGKVGITHLENLMVVDLKNKLLIMGYPEKGTVEGFDKFASNAKSYVSCAIGKISKN